MATVGSVSTANLGVQSCFNMGLSSKAVCMIQQCLSIHWTVCHSNQCRYACRHAVLADLRCNLLCTVSVRTCVLICCTIHLSMPKQTGCCLWAGNCNMCGATFVAQAQSLLLGKWHVSPARLCARMVTPWKCHLRQHGETLHDN